MSNLKKMIQQNQKQNRAAIDKAVQKDSKLKAEMQLLKNQDQKSKRKAKKAS